MIDCVSISTSHFFGGNPIYEQHRLRYECIVQRQSWNVPAIRNMEYDQYDNPAAYYLVWRDNGWKCARLVASLSDRPALYAGGNFPSSRNQDRTAQKARSSGKAAAFASMRASSPQMRKRIVQEIIIGYLEFGLANGIDRHCGVMYPAYWRNVFHRQWLGCRMDWRAEKSQEGHKIVAGSLTVSEAVLEKVRREDWHSRNCSQLWRKCSKL